MQLNAVVVLLVPPVPENPVVSDCRDSEEYCTLSVEREGTLTCVLNGIRPMVNLEWHVVSKGLTGMIEFTEDEVTVNTIDMTFQISLTSKFVIHPAAIDRVTIECRTSKKLWETLNLSTKLELIIINSKSLKILHNNSSILKLEMTYHMRMYLKRL